MGDENEDYWANWTSGRTHIYWDFKRYPVPNDDAAHLRKIYFNIESVLEEEYHFNGTLQIMAYGIQPDQYKNRDVMIRHRSENDGIIMDILNETRKSPEHDFDRDFDRQDVVVITKQDQVDKQDPVDRELLRILGCLASRDHKVWLVAPPEEGNPLDSYEAVHANFRLLERKNRPQSSASF